ncbi:Putative ribonuclease H protein At1g65750, partial [Linum perenne]
CIRNRRKTKFWTDRWLDSGTLLIDVATNIQGVDVALTVADFVTPHGNWDLSKLYSCLPSDAGLQVMGMTPPCDSLGEDSAAWGLEPNGRFTIKSAYLFIKEVEQDDQGELWKSVWKWEGEAKIWHFMLLASHGKLMTNEERRRRHLTLDAACQECNDGFEDIEHILRKCHFAQQVWRSMMPHFLDGSAALDFKAWWVAGIKNNKWALMFSVITWLLWRRRNHFIFENENMLVPEFYSQAKFWIHLYSSCWKALQVSGEASGSARKAHLIGWRPPEEGWFSLNSDGSLYSGPNRAAAGGVIRDNNGRFVSAFDDTRIDVVISLI